MFTIPLSDDLVTSGTAYSTDMLVSTKKENHSEIKF